MPTYLLLVLLLASEFLDFGTAVVPNDKCVEDKDCKPLKNSHCDGGFCICALGFVPMENRCVPMIGTECQEDNSCKLNNTNCEDRKCQCYYGFVFTEEDGCLKRADYGEECKYDLQCTCRNFGNCDPKAPFADLTCSRNKCSCPEDHHYIRNKEICVKSAKHLGDSCSTDDECLSVKNTVCNDNQCVCPEKHFVEQEQCLHGLGAKCSYEDNDCSAKNSYCGFFDCECNHEFVEFSVDMCVPVKKYTESCLSDKQCSCQMRGQCSLQKPYVDLVCFRNETCGCFEGFHYVESVDSCIQSAKAIDDTCEEEDNCLLITDTECKQGKCQCIENYFDFDGQCRQGLNSSCPNDEHCSAVPNAVCVENVCQCKEQFVPISTGVCAAQAKHGEPCKFHEQCWNNETLTTPPYEGLVCNGTCTCSKGFHYVQAEKVCVPSAAGVGKNCTVNDNCGLLANTVCWDNRCSCENYHYEQRNGCVPGLGARCSRNCEAANSICASTGRCICAPGHVSAGPDRCVPVTGLGELCEMDEQCSCLFQLCDLKQPNRDLVCSNGTCSCPPGYHFNSKSKFCVHSATGLEEQCDSDENCAPLPFSECYNKKCVCKRNYFASAGKCQQGLGSDCSTTSECSAVEHAECVGNKCACAERFLEQSTELCVPVRSFGEECVYVEQCSVLTTNATCEANKDGARVCGCGTGRHHHTNGCFVTRKLGERCDSSSECFVTSRYDSVTCLENKCTCVPGSVKLNETYCDGAGSIVASAFLVLFMVLFKVAV